jgi:hypothetical protein
MLLDMLARGAGGLHGLARSPCSLALHRNLILALERKRFPDKTPVRARPLAMGLLRGIDRQARAAPRDRHPRRRRRGRHDRVGEPEVEPDHPALIDKCSALVVLVDILQVVAEGQGQELFAMQLISHLDWLMTVLP